MKAVGVAYANEINKATDIWGVDQALLQSVIEVANGPDNNIAGLPEDAKQYARTYARNRGRDDGEAWAEANIVACAWWVVRLQRQYGNVWSAVKAYFEMSPVGEAKMRRIYNVTYPKWRKAWRNL